MGGNRRVFDHLQNRLSAKLSKTAAETAFPFGPARTNLAGGLLDGVQNWRSMRLRHGTIFHVDRWKWQGKLRCLQVVANSVPIIFPSPSLMLKPTLFCRVSREALAAGSATHRDDQPITEPGHFPLALLNAAPTQGIS